jgi:DNA-binding transcriptional LysR family regulator
MDPAASRAMQQRHRTPDGFMATPAGQDLGEVAERMEGEVLSVEGCVFGRDADLRSKLRVSTLDIVFFGFHEAFASFMRRYPSVELSLTTPLHNVSLTRREADVALRLSDSPPEHLVGRKIGRLGFAPYASQTLVDRIGVEAGYDEYPWIGRDEHLGRGSMDAWMARHAPNARFVMRLDGNAMVLRQAISAGIGVHLLPCFDGDSDPKLRRLGPIDPDFGRDLWLLTMPELRSTSRIRAFMDHMEGALRAHRAVLAGAES